MKIFGWRYKEYTNKWIRIAIVVALVFLLLSIVFWFKASLDFYNIRMSKGLSPYTKTPDEPFRGLQYLIGDIPTMVSVFVPFFMAVGIYGIGLFKLKKVRDVWKEELDEWAGGSKIKRMIGKIGMRYSKRPLILVGEPKEVARKYNSIIGILLIIFLINFGLMFLWSGLGMVVYGTPLEYLFYHVIV